MAYQQTEQMVWWQVVSKMIYSAGVDVNDLYDQQVESMENVHEKRLVGELGTEKLVSIAWDAMNGSDEGLSREQIQRSALGEAMVDHWSKLDADADSKVTKQELTAYVEAVQKAAKRKNWLANALYYADVGVMQHVAAEVTRRRMELASIEVLSTTTLLARVWRTLDSDSNLKVSADELKFSCFGELMSEWWHLLDSNADNDVSVEEWNRFWEAREAEWGSAKMRRVVANLVYEADVDVSDLVNKNVEQTSDLKEKHKIAQVVAQHTKDLVGRLFGVVDSNADGRLTKKEMAISVLGEAMQPYWGRLDADSDGYVSAEEFLQFFGEVEAGCTPSQFQGWVSNMVYSADVDVSDLVTATMQEQAEAQAALEAKQAAKAKEKAEAKAQRLAAAGIIKEGELDIQQGRFWYSWHR